MYIYHPAITTIQSIPTREKQRERKREKTLVRENNIYIF